MASYLPILGLIANSSGSSGNLGNLFLTSGRLDIEYFNGAVVKFFIGADEVISVWNASSAVTPSVFIGSSLSCPHWTASPLSWSNLAEETSDALLMPNTVLPLILRECAFISSISLNVDLNTSKLASFSSEVAYFDGSDVFRKT